MSLGVVTQSFPVAPCAVGGAIYGVEGDFELVVFRVLHEDRD